jgi:hypothetical protein
MSDPTEHELIVKAFAEAPPEPDDEPDWGPEPETPPPPDEEPAWTSLPAAPPVPDEEPDW